MKSDLISRLATELLPKVGIHIEKYGDLDEGEFLKALEIAVTAIIGDQEGLRDGTGAGRSAQRGPAEQHGHQDASPTGEAMMSLGEIALSTTVNPAAKALAKHAIGRKVQAELDARIHQDRADQEMREEAAKRAKAISLVP